MNYNSFSSRSYIDMDKLSRVYSFNDIKIKPILTNIKSKSEVDISTQLTKNITLKTPFVLLSSKVDEIIDISTNGGIGIINKMPIDDQINMIKKIKKYINIFNTDIVTVNINSTFTDLQEIFKNNEVEWVFVIDYYSTCLGIISRDHLEITTVCNSLNTSATDIMTDINKIKYFNQYDYDWLSMTSNPVKFILDEFKTTPIIPILSENKKILGILSLKDLIKFYKLKDNLLFDSYGKLLVAASIGISNDYMERVNKLVCSGLDILYINIDNAYNQLMFDIVKDIKIRYPSVIIIVGNINSVEGYKACSELNIDAVVIGNETEFGQFSLIQECKNIYNIPIINNSGIPSQAQNIFKAILAGANTFLINSDNLNNKNWKDIYLSKDIIYPMVSINIKTISELHSSNSIEYSRLL